MRLCRLSRPVGRMVASPVLRQGLSTKVQTSATRQALPFSNAVMYRFPPVFEESVTDSSAKFLLKLCTDFRAPQVDVWEARLLATATMKDIAEHLASLFPGIASVRISADGRDIEPTKQLQDLYDLKDVVLHVSLQDGSTHAVSLNGGFPVRSGVLRKSFRKNYLPFVIMFAPLSLGLLFAFAVYGLGFKPASVRRRQE